MVAPQQEDVGNQPSLGALVHDMTEQMSRLVRDEIRLAQAEMTQKGKRAGVGLGLFSAAGLLAFFGVAVLVATAVLGLTLVVPAWLAALLVAVVLLTAAAVVAWQGRSNVQRATPPTPEEAIHGLKEDIATVKGERGREHAV